MLIQITNRCYMECPHCMQESGPRGRHMSDETFGQVVTLCHQLQPAVISVTGGKPTEHPDWFAMARTLFRYAHPIGLLTVITNGAWIEDDEQCDKMHKLIRNARGRVKVQVYSNPKYYKSHKWTCSHKRKFLKLGCITDFASPIFMQDLGRARRNCTEEVEQSTHVPSCINSHLIARQSGSLHQFLSMCIQAAKFCRPLIDINGNIHMSESWKCPAVAHVSEGVEEIFRKMQEAEPCRKCRLYKNFEALHPKEMQLLARK